MVDYTYSSSDPVNKKRLEEVIANLDGDFVFHINTIKTQRSLHINNYYWGVVLEAISEYSGHTKDELHDIFATSMLPLVIFRNYQDLTSTECSSKEMWEYCLKIRHWFLKFTGRIIPDPRRVIRPGTQPWPDGIRNGFEEATQLA